MPDPVQSTRMGAVRRTDLMAVLTVMVRVMVRVVAIMRLGTMFGTEVPIWLVHAAHDVSIPPGR